MRETPAFQVYWPNLQPGFLEFTLQCRMNSVQKFGSELNNHIALWTLRENAPTDPVTSFEHSHVASGSAKPSCSRKARNPGA
jgi:hypothetical protein